MFQELIKDQQIKTLVFEQKVLREQLEYEQKKFARLLKDYKMFLERYKEIKKDYRELVETIKSGGL
jgi:hypothetical protein